MWRFLTVVAVAAVLVPSAACTKNPTSPTPTVQSGPVVATPEPIDPVGKPSGTSGTITSFSGDGNAFQFMIDNTLVRGDATTDTGGAALGNGMNVSVSGWLRGDYLFATKIRVN